MGHLTVFTRILVAFSLLIVVFASAVAFGEPGGTLNVLRWGEGLSAPAMDSPGMIEARMFTLSDVPVVCEGAERAAILRLEEAESLRVGDCLVYEQFKKIVALDANGNLVPNLPVAVSVEYPDAVLSRCTDGTSLCAWQPGEFVVSVQSACAATPLVRQRIVVRSRHRTTGS